MKWHFEQGLGLRTASAAMVPKFSREKGQVSREETDRQSLRDASSSPFTSSTLKDLNKLHSFSLYKERVQHHQSSHNTSGKTKRQKQHGHRSHRWQLSPTYHQLRVLLLLLLFSWNMQVFPEP